MISILVIKLGVATILDNGSLDNLDNKSSNKYEKKFKNRKTFIDAFFYL
jgi:hypothetical protein